ncbi:terminase [Clostridium polynesiense]|uniref:terminase n=1 Tax=Clostridium polynesiense TaxID=1325933 RepID=UPI00058B65A5|nr:terminase [Clostridium polynesiense]
MAEAYLLSEKYKAFLKCDAPTEFLEGTTAAGKTTVGILKFMFKVAESTKKLHILSGLDLGTIEKNIINKDLGICDVFGPLVQYNSNGKGQHSLPHILYHTDSGDKIIYVLGYDNKTRWKKALGGQYGCLYIDEINIADMEYVREASMRCDYLMGTLNPDDPNLPVYKEYINCSRPLPEWVKETPKEIREMLNEEPKPNWVHWFFSFVHNAGLSEEKKQQIILNVPKGTKLYKNKIQGLRGRATGLIFSNFTREKNVVSKDYIKKLIQDKKLKFMYFSCGVDTSYSQESPDTFAFIFQGITDKGQVIILDEEVYNNADLQIPLAPSDIPPRLFKFLERNRSEWGFARDVFIDSADQATITELKKFKRTNPCLYNFLNAYKKITIIDRIHLQLGWINTNDTVYYLVLDHCRHHIGEHEAYSWKEDKYEPEDANDHTINASQYGWIPFKNKIGIGG